MGAVNTTSSNPLTKYFSTQPANLPNLNSNQPFTTIWDHNNYSQLLHTHTLKRDQFRFMSSMMLFVYPAGDGSNSSPGQSCSRCLYINFGWVVIYVYSRLYMHILVLNIGGYNIHEVFFPRGSFNSDD